MTEDTKITPSTDEIASSTEALGVVQETIEYFLEAASVDRVFGEPIQHGDTMIIPTAEVFGALGFGAGYGSGQSTDSDEKSGENSGSGGGGGGGGRVFSRPVAVVVSSPEGVHVHEVVDPTKIALAAITASGFMVSMLFRMLKPKR
ncbi:MAG: GerW family sporulation protein [Anaerolineales bacterium]